MFCYGNHCTRFCFRNIWYSCLDRNVMHRWNRNFNIPPTGRTLGIGRLSVPGERGIWWEGLPGVGNSTFAWVGWGGQNWTEVSGFKWFFFRALKALTKINTWKICEQLTYKKRSSKVLKYLLRHVWEAESAQISVILDCNDKGRRQLFLWRGNLNDSILYLLYFCSYFCFWFWLYFSSANTSCLDLRVKIERELWEPKLKTAATGT